MRIVFVACSVACSMACVIASSSMLPRIYPGLRAAPSADAPAHLRHQDAERPERVVRTYQELQRCRPPECR